MPSMTSSYVKNVLTNNSMAGEIPLTKEELKDLCTINPEVVYFTAIDKTEFLTESEPKSSQIHCALQTELELPEALISPFEPTAINISIVDNLGVLKHFAT